MRRVARTAVLLMLGLSAGLPCGPANAAAQSVRVRDLTVAEDAVPVRLVGYGLVVGLNGTGDRAMGLRGSAQTVQSVVNLLRRFDVEIPPQLLRTRNVAAVLVTAEMSPYLRPGGRFEVKVASLGDARSLRGGVLWMTPLVADAGQNPVASAQGPLLLPRGDGRRRVASLVETSASIPAGGVLEEAPGNPTFADMSHLLLKQPDLGTAVRIAEAINQQVGRGIATVDDPGSIALNVPAGPTRMATLSRIGDLAVQPERASKILIDGRYGTVVAGGDIKVGEAVVSHGAVTLTIGGTAAPPAAAPPAGEGGVPGPVQVAVGASVQDVAAALKLAQAPAESVAAIFGALRDVGAISAEVVIQ